MSIALSIIPDGLCTTWLHRVCQSRNFLNHAPDQERGRNYNLVGIETTDSTVMIPIFLRRSTTFTPPVDLTKPMILVGPGTVSPLHFYDMFIIICYSTCRVSLPFVVFFSGGAISAWLSSKNIPKLMILSVVHVFFFLDAEIATLTISIKMISSLLQKMVLFHSFSLPFPGNRSTRSTYSIVYNNMVRKFTMSSLLSDISLKHFIALALLFIGN